MVPIVLTAVLLSATPASSAEAAWRACVDATATDAEWSRCGGAYVREAEASLDAAWARLMIVAPEKTRSDLIAEHRAWLAYRETACRFYRNDDWGREGEILDGPACLASLIERRTAVLSDDLGFLTRR